MLPVSILKDSRAWLGEITGAPGVSKGRAAAAVRAVRWKVATALGYERAQVTVGPAKFSCYPGFTEASGLIYVGFLEWNETAFVARYLRSGDLFFDIGANIGPYSVVAGTFVSDVTIVSVEPGDAARDRLIENLEVNGLPTDKVVGKAVGAEPGTVRFTTGLDTMNAVATGGATNTVEVEQVTVDQLAEGRDIALMKIDVEGLELPVFKGAVEQLAKRPGPTVLFELNGFCRNFDIEPPEVTQHMIDAGYELFEYDGIANDLVAFSGNGIPASNNIVATTEPEAVRERLRSAAPPVDLTNLPIAMKLERRAVRAE